MEANTSRRAVGLRDKIPDIDKTLETVKFLSGRKVYFSPRKIRLSSAT